MSRRNAKITVWAKLSELIRVNPVAAATFAEECSATLADASVSLDWLGMADELEALTNAPMGSPTGEGDTPAPVTYLLVNDEGDAVDGLMVSGPEEGREEAAWAEFAARMDVSVEELELNGGYEMKEFLGVIGSLVVGR